MRTAFHVGECKNDPCLPPSKRSPWPSIYSTAALRWIASRRCMNYNGCENDAGRRRSLPPCGRRNAIPPQRRQFGLAHLAVQADTAARRFIEARTRKRRIRFWANDFRSRNRRVSPRGREDERRRNVPTRTARMAASITIWARFALSVGGYRYRLDDGNGRRSGNDASQREPRRPQQIAELGFAA